MSFALKIGLEVHVELATPRKLFCSCATDFGQEANTQVCPVCLGEPGHKPELNEAVLDLALLACLGLDCTISRQVLFDRKHYQAADMPKGYQITQYTSPLGRNGRLPLPDLSQPVRIRQVHLEEDSGRAIQTRAGQGGGIDYNRSGLALLEIVTEPELVSAKQAVSFLEELRRLLLFLQVSDCRIEEGSMRADVNLSLNRVDTSLPGTPVELKNLSSFRAVRRAIEEEASRQAKILLAGGAIKPETRRWDEKENRSFTLRQKQAPGDYRYSPEQDLAPVWLQEAAIARKKAELPELPWQKQARLLRDFNLTSDQARLLTAEPYLAGFFEKTAVLSQDAAAAAGWLLGSVPALCRELGRELAATQLTPAGLARLIRLVGEKRISRASAGQVLAEMMQTGVDPDLYINRQGLTLLADQAELSALARQVLQENTAAVESYFAGKEKIKTFLLGQLMQKSHGQAEPQAARQALDAELAAWQKEK